MTLPSFGPQHCADIVYEDLKALRLGDVFTMTIPEYKALRKQGKFRMGRTHFQRGMKYLERSGRLKKVGHKRRLIYWQLVNEV